MEQSEIRQMLEMMAQMNAKVDTNKAEAKREREAGKAEMKAQIGGLASRMDVD
jgi:hypothetical protein